MTCPCVECGCEPHPGPCSWGPDQCWKCGRYQHQDERDFPTGVVDLDPGDPEVGPQPDIATVSICPECMKK